MIHTRLSLRIVYCKKSAVNFHRTLQGKVARIPRGRKMMCK
ncbi:hypothetical protein HMPREF9095_1246 [Haemophilus aegyptius ATCC 11116]|nr:hypothetical protein HMPREF9095_1246 [Haemophilus aegyptius ATCC 11116]